MDIQLNIYKYYNLGYHLENKEIIDNFKKTGINNIKKFKINQESDNPKFISYPEPIKFKYKQKEFLNTIYGKAYTYGAMSLMTKIEYKNLSIADFQQKLKESDPRENIEQILDNLYKKIHDKFEALQDKILKDFNHLYCVYCINNNSIKKANEIVKNNENIIVSLLTDRLHKTDFSQQQKKRVLANNISLYDSDYTAIHWNNSLIIDTDKNYNDRLFIIELANIQFIKLQVYDEYIDNILSEYMIEDNNKFSTFIPFIKSGISQKVNEITQFRVELEKMKNLMDNFEKYKGNWYLARIYYLTSNSFQINKWKDLIETRIMKVNNFYNLANEEINRNRMLYLNILMLLLFILWFIGF